MRILHHKPLRLHPRPAGAPRSGAANLFVAILLIAICSASPLFAQGQWTVIGQPTHSDLNALSFRDGAQGWIAGDGGVILMTNNGGESWTPQPSTVTFDIVDIDVIDGQFGWALAQQFPTDSTFDYGTTVLRTTDGGSAWFAQAVFQNEFYHAVDFTDSLHGCLGGDLGNLWWTSDGGVSWTPAVVDSPDFAHWPVRDFEFYSPTFGIATGGYYDVTGLVWRTTDGGHTWKHQRVAGEPVFGSCFLDSLTIVSVGGDLDFGSSKVTSTNGGLDWDYRYLGFWGQAGAVSFRNADEGWAPLGFAGTMMYTLNAGRDWIAIPTPGDIAMYDVSFPNANTGYMVGLEGTILKYANPVGIGDPGPVLTDQGLFLGNRPNPVHTTTEFVFRIPRFGPVTLKLYDSTGREIATLVDEILPPGTYRRAFDAGGLAGGVYYSRLVVGSSVETRKTILLK